LVGHLTAHIGSRSFAVAVCHDGEVVSSVAGAASLADRRAKLIPAGALPGGACRARLDGRLAVDLLASAMQRRRLRVTG